MLAEDILPSRIQAAKDTINTFIKERKDDLFGMIVFAGRPIVSVPFSEDTIGISNIVSGITPYSIRQDLPGLSWTAIGDAILLANHTLSGVTENSSIILITDGRANVGIDPVVAAIESQFKWIPIFSIAIWGTSDSILSYTDPYTQKRVTLLDEDGEPLKSDIDEELLRNISKITWGAYFRASASRELYKYWDNISKQIWKKETKVTEIRFVPYRPHILVLLILLLIIERMATSRIFYKNPIK